ncbi:MAG TPA: delta-60 repeat domain-containing protein, partial [Bacteroidia bacterium]|nr:delta-60 repeat domain-containing protein [Bacteroidia bacterium]
MLTATICLLTSYTASAQPGALDLTFDGDGRVTVPVIAGADDNGYSVAIQSDGKIVVAGVTSTGPSDDFAVVRFSADGSLDSTFDTDGVVTTVIGSSSAIMEVVIQSDGKIVVAGYNDNGGNFDFAVVRYNSNGSLDT